MGRTNYHRGRDKEYRVKRALEENGMYVVRSAGSHGLFDLIAIDNERKIIWLIQVKKNKKSKDCIEYNSLARILEGFYFVKVVLIENVKEILKCYKKHGTR
ncbi:MAG TPA: hypothetical protein EYH22_03510 [Candidatus Nanopusillus sp.]|nr:hypothetical protein [Candidatus Nanopusillus sp.]